MHYLALLFSLLIFAVPTSFAGGQDRVDADSQEADAPPKAFQLPGLTVDLEQRFVDLDATIAHAQGYLEVVACTKDTKDHEALVVIKSQPRHLHAALLLLRVNNGNPAMRVKVEPKEEGEKPRWVFVPPRGDLVDLSLVLEGPGGQAIERPVSDFIMYVDQEDQAVAHLGLEEDKAEEDDEALVFPDTFMFMGSQLTDVPDGPRQYMADHSGHVVTISTFGDEVLGLPGRHSSENRALIWHVNPETRPAAGTKVMLRIRPHEPEEDDAADAD